MIKESRRLALVGLIAASISLVAMTVEAGILARLDQGEHLTVAAIGTSLTAPGGSWWLLHVGDWLKNKYPDQVIIDNLGIGGSNSRDSGLPQQLPTVLARGADVIFIEFSMNDAHGPNNISLQASKNNLQTMITRINTWASNNGRNVDIVVQTMNNCTGANNASRPNLAQYYQGCRDVVQANPGVLLIDNYVNWVNLYNSQSDHAMWNSYVPDGIHPNDQGAQAVIVPEIQKVLLSQLPANQKALWNRAPEPTKLALLAAGVVGLSACAWRKRK